MGRNSLTAARLGQNVGLQNHRKENTKAEFIQLQDTKRLNTGVQPIIKVSPSVMQRNWLRMPHHICLCCTKITYICKNK